MLKKILVYAIASIILMFVLILTLYLDYSYKKITTLEREHSNQESEEHNHTEESLVVQLTDEQIKKMGLDIRQANAGQLLISLATRGKVVLHPDRVAHILPKLSGVVREARKNVGDFVRAGEIIAILESREVADAKANYLAALSKEGLTLSLLNRERRLYEKGISSEQDYLNASASYDESYITTQLSRQKLYALGIDEKEIEDLMHQNYSSLRVYEIRAPLDGTILKRHLTQGEFIESSTTIYEIADLRTVWLEIGVYPKDLFKIREGQQVEVRLPINDQIARTQLMHLIPIIEEKNITFKAIAELDNREGFYYPGSFINVNIIMERVPATIIIAREAVQNIEGENCVFAVCDKGFKKKTVQVGREDPYHVEILAGLDPGEFYAAKKTFLLKAELNKNDVEDND